MAIGVYVGTSGWAYAWNPDRFDWYACNSGLNAVELNASFYRFPLAKHVASWSEKSPKDLRWVVKVNRLITHVFRFDKRALDYWKMFKGLFQPLEAILDLYLFQLPPSTLPTNAFRERLEGFISQTHLGARFALEGRHTQWFEPVQGSWARSLGITLVSVDSPDLPRGILNANGVVYLRMHGRTAWYTHSYTDGELSEVVERVREARPTSVYVFLNNDHDMLTDARRVRALLQRAFRA